MSNKQTDLNASLNLDALDLGDLSQEDTIDGNVGLDLKNPADKNLNEVRKMALLSRIPVTLTLEVASVDISLSDLMAVNNDSVLELDKRAGEPLDIKVNGILFGKAEVVVLNDKYGLRIIEFNNKDLGEFTQ